MNGPQHRFAEVFASWLLARSLLAQGPRPEDEERELDNGTDLRNHLAARLMALPAPSASEVYDKIEVLAYEISISGNCRALLALASIQGDLKRLMPVDR